MPVPTPSDANEDRLLCEARELAEHPAFDAAIMAYATGLARFREAPRILNMIVSTEVRWRILGYLLYLDADRERFGPEGGATYGRLLQLSASQAGASPRAVKTVLALLRLGGLVRVTHDPFDRRIRHYRPTARLFDYVKDWMRYGTAALDILKPGSGLSAFVDDQAFIDQFSVSGGRAHMEDAIPLADRVPVPLSSLSAMAGSHSVILAVTLAHLQQAQSPSHHSIAKRFGLSRSQVSNVVSAGVARDVFQRSSDGHLEPTAALLSSFRTWVSIELAFYARHMRRPR